MNNLIIDHINSKTYQPLIQCYILQQNYMLIACKCCKLKDHNLKRKDYYFSISLDQTNLFKLQVDSKLKVYTNLLDIQNILEKTRNRNKETIL